MHVSMSAVVTTEPFAPPAANPETDRESSMRIAISAARNFLMPIGCFFITTFLLSLF